MVDDVAPTEAGNSPGSLDTPDFPDTPDASACADCGAALHGPFCAVCGQRVESRMQPLRGLVAQAAGEMFGFDSRLWRTMRTLATRPGALSVAYLEGQRTRYVPPFRVYLIVSFALFFATGLARTQLLTNVSTTRAAPVEAPPGAETPAPVPDAVLEDAEAEPSLPAGVVRVPVDPTAVNAAVNRQMSQVLIVLVPVFGLLLMGAHRRVRRFYAEHLVVAVHVQTFAFLAGLVVIVLDRLLAVAGVQAATGLRVTAIWPVVVAIYLVLALRRVYGESWPRVIVKALVVAFLYALVITYSVISFSLWLITRNPELVAQTTG